MSTFPCLDRWQHARLYAGNETTWRKTAAQIAADMEHGCPHCTGALPADESIPSGVLGFHIGERVSVR